jgi:segregation and condensation protein A
MFEAPSGPAYDAWTVPTEFSVELPLYAGPFKGLADLILSQRMDVCDVPLARITDRFLAWGMEHLDGWTLEEASWFLSVCAALIELKVGRLLPKPEPLAQEDDLLGGISPDLVYARSLELAAFRRIAALLAARFEEAARSIPRTVGPPPELAHLYPDPMQSIDASALAKLAAEVLRPPPELDLSHVTPIRVSLSDALHAIESQLTERPEARFRELLEDCEERIHVVVRFLAILELYREGKVELSQAEVFGDIEVRWHASTGRRGSESEEVEA